MKSLRRLINSSDCIVPVYLNKPLSGLDRFTPGLVIVGKEVGHTHPSFYNSITKTLTEKKGLYRVHYLLHPNKTYETAGSLLQTIPNHLLSKIFFINTHYLNNDHAELLENKPVVIDITPPSMMPSITKYSILELCSNLIRKYKYAWSYHIDSNTYDNLIINKIRVFSTKLCLPVFDATAQDGVCVNVICSQPISSNKEYQYYFSLVFSNYTTNIVLFDGAVLRDIGANLNIRQISSILRNEITSIYTYEEDVVCVE
jgi:hypothetical protein